LKGLFRNHVGKYYNEKIFSYNDFKKFSIIIDYKVINSNILLI